MRKSVARAAGEMSVSEPVSSMQNGSFNPHFFKSLQDLYLAKTGYNLVLSDTNGSIQMGLPDCVRFPCMKSCRECRENIVSEALRTGKVCVDACHEGYILWGLPLAVNGKTRGGFIVIGGEHDLKAEKDRFTRACQELYRMMHEHELLPESHRDVVPDLEEIHRFVHRKSFASLSEAFEINGKPLIDCLQTADFDDASRHFELIQSSLKGAEEVPLELVRGLIGDLVFSARRQFVAGGMDEYACFAEAGMLIEEISRARTVDQIEGVLEAFFERFVILSRQRPKDPDDQLIEKATTYLEEHIRDDLTRESVARAVGISPSHFSRLIREKKGRTFTDLLNQYRIERASKLLVRSSHSLAQIASETGFCDQSYFSKVFRRYKDMTPAKYREQHQL
jgi:AraC-like DNA-binding protein